jgi:hypothetical protein
LAVFSYDIAENCACTRLYTPLSRWTLKFAQGVVANIVSNRAQQSCCFFMLTIFHADDSVPTAYQLYPSVYNQNSISAARQIQRH